MATFTANINLGKFMQSKWSQDAPTIEAAQRLVFAHLERILSVEPTDQRGEEAHFCIRQYMQLLALPEPEPAVTSPLSKDALSTLDKIAHSILSDWPLAIIAELQATEMLDMPAGVKFPDWNHVTEKGYAAIQDVAADE